MHTQVLLNVQIANRPTFAIIDEELFQNDVALLIVLILKLVVSFAHNIKISYFEEIENY